MGKENSMSHKPKETGRERKITIKSMNRQTDRQTDRQPAPLRIKAVYPSPLQRNTTQRLKRGNRGEEGEWRRRGRRRTETRGEMMHIIYILCEGERREETRVREK